MRHARDVTRRSSRFPVLFEYPVPFWEKFVRPIGRAICILWVNSSRASGMQVHGHQCVNVHNWLQEESRDFLYVCPRLNSICLNLIKNNCYLFSLSWVPGCLVKGHILV